HGAAGQAPASTVSSWGVGVVPACRKKQAQDGKRHTRRQAKPRDMHQVRSLTFPRQRIRIPLGVDSGQNPKKTGRDGIHALTTSSAQVSYLKAVPGCRKDFD